MLPLGNILFQIAGGIKFNLSVIHDNCSENKQGYKKDDVTVGNVYR